MGFLTKKLLRVWNLRRLWPRRADPLQLATCGPEVEITSTTDPGVCAATVTFSGCIPSITYACAPASGTSFAVGSTEVQCSGADSVGMESQSILVSVQDAEPPVLAALPDIRQSSCGGTTAQVSFTAEASDNCVVEAVVCNPESGSWFPVGNTTVECSARDTSGNMANQSFKVSVFYEEVFTQHPDIQISSTCEDFAQVMFEVETSANCAVVLVCEPSSGSLFPTGSTEVNCTATGLTGGTSNMSFDVNVTRDSTPPVLDTLPDMRFDAGCETSAQVNFQVAAADNCGAVQPVCVPPSGSWFPLGNTTVGCTATDSAGNSANSSFQLEVVGGSTPPSLDAHPKIEPKSPNCQPMQVEFEVAARGGCAAETECIPPSGSLFPLGPTTVRCTASDAFGNVANMSFEVNVWCDKRRRRKRRYSGAYSYTANSA